MTTISPIDACPIGTLAPTGIEGHDNGIGPAPIVMTVDAGGTTMRFTALRNGRSMSLPLVMPTNGRDIDDCLRTLEEGFRRIQAGLPEPAAAISFAFPGPADYRQGIIGDLPNLPAFRGGIALGPFLEEAFGLPVTIANDGDLFTYGEAVAGLLPEMNRRLAGAGSSRRVGHLLGLTLGTGCGGGLVIDHQPFRGDSGRAAEVWQLPSRFAAGKGIEAVLSIRGLRSIYAAEAGISADEAPNPATLGSIAGEDAAARRTWEIFGDALGDLLADLLPLVDASTVIGGGLSGASRWFLPGAVRRIRERGLVQPIHLLEDEAGWQGFTAETVRSLPIHRSNRTAIHRQSDGLGLGLTRLGTSEAIWYGAYALAIRSLPPR